jgi:MtN3 and saliva related transmembrane protein
MDFTTTIGTIAATLTTVSFLPQAIQTIRTRDTKSISLPMYVIFVLGIIAWLSYGLLMNNSPIILSNIFTLILSGTILVYKIMEKK